MPAKIIDQRWTSYSDTSSDSGYSDSSEQSQNTAPTVYSYGSRRPSVYHEIPQQSYCGTPWHPLSNDLCEEVSPRASVDTYASTVASEEDLDDQIPAFDVPDESNDRFASTATPSTPPDFAELFPSTHRLQIKHDDSTLDGNMNLRIDTEIRSSEGRRVDLTLFHLRMHDLKNREFSLRRYCRDSGREVCHSARKYAKPGTVRAPGLQRSMSNALSTLRSKSEPKSSTKTPLKRADSGYGSLEEDDDVWSAAPAGRAHIPLPTNTTHLEFSNYAHIDIKRRGTKSSKRYEFEYWGVSYAWKRSARKIGDVKEISYHLMDTHSSHAIAHIVPDVLSHAELSAEDVKGGWIPPSSLWISDPKFAQGLTDVADAIVASGLVALVDDCIKARWHQKNRFQMNLPALMKSPLHMNMEYIGPKRLIDEVFNRRSPATMRHATPARQVSVGA